MQEQVHKQAEALRLCKKPIYLNNAELLEEVKGKSTGRNQERCFSAHQMSLGETANLRSCRTQISNLVWDQSLSLDCMSILKEESKDPFNHSLLLTGWPSVGLEALDQRLQRRSLHQHIIKCVASVITNEPYIGVIA